MSVADKTYLAVPTLTAFTIVRSALKAGREYTTQVGETIQRLETEGRRAAVTFTTYQPVIKVVDGTPTIVRYTDLGDDTFDYPEEAPAQQEEAGGAPVTVMADVIDDAVLVSLRDVLVEVMTGSIPDFAEQAPEMAAVGVPRYFHIDRIQFRGREDRAKEATLKVLMGVYADADCTKLRRYIQQDFVSAGLLADRQKTHDQLITTLTAVTAEANDSQTTVERKAELAIEIARLQAGLAEVNAQLADLQPLTPVVAKAAIKTVIKTITRSVLEDAVVNCPQYSAIDVDALLTKFDAAYDGLKAAIAKA